MASQKLPPRPLALKVLIATEGVFAVVGFASGLALFLSPSGNGIGLSLDLLRNTPVSDFTLVGLFFIAFYGVLPALATYGLVTKRRWDWTNPINKWTHQTWAWTASATVGIILLLWIGVELALLGFLSGIGGVLQIVMAALGALMLFLVSRRTVRSYMRMEG